MPDFPWHRNRYRGGYPAAAPGQTQLDLQPTRTVGRKVVRPGRAFLRRMIDLLRSPQCPYHHTRLNLQFRADLQWWRTFAAGWNGIAVLPAITPASVEVTSDASGTMGVWGPEPLPLVPDRVAGCVTTTSHLRSCSRYSYRAQHGAGCSVAAVSGAGATTRRRLVP